MDILAAIRGLKQSPSHSISRPSVHPRPGPLAAKHDKHKDVVTMDRTDSAMGGLDTDEEALAVDGKDMFIPICSGIETHYIFQRRTQTKKNSLKSKRVCGKFMGKQPPELYAPGPARQFQESPLTVFTDTFPVIHPPSSPGHHQ